MLRDDPMSEDQIILIDKPAGISSFGVVAKVRARLRDQFKHKVKVGHTGTLDPFATGLLILLSGKMTKKSSEFLKLDKIYEATLKLGYTSTTGDPEGEIHKFTKKRIRTSLVEDLSEVTTENEGASPVTTGASDPCPKLSDVEFAIKKFIGEIEQTPPRFSAIKINGQRAYKLARKGADFEIPSRKVKIYSIDILNYNYPELKIRVHCSSGTYIRTLAEDIGEALGTGAYLTALRRTNIANYSVDDALML
ncbi:tRNA pseudouridine(55) synthase TruB [Candidatus Saccharibacteria bacterium]|nr:tRNA pseudouridine(55) synthase TruB [Candidatus Saccharibacteria bacterium]